MHVLTSLEVLLKDCNYLKLFEKLMNYNKN
jgi:hypothetical protein